MKNSSVRNMLMASACLFGSLVALAEPADKPKDRPPQHKAEKAEQRTPRNMDAAIEKALKNLKASKPEEYNRLVKLQQEDRAEFFKEIRKYMPRKTFFSNEIMRLERQCVELGRQYRTARTPEERKAIKKELEECVIKATDSLIADLKQRVEKMQTHIKEMEEGRDDIIQRRIKTLLEAPEKQSEHGQVPKHFHDGFNMPPMNPPPMSEDFPEELPPPPPMPLEKQ